MWRRQLWGLRGGRRGSVGEVLTSYVDGGEVMGWVGGGGSVDVALPLTTAAHDVSAAVRLVGRVLDGLW